MKLKIIRHEYYLNNLKWLKNISIIVIKHRMKTYSKNFSFIVHIHLKINHRVSCVLHKHHMYQLKNLSFIVSIYMMSIVWNN